MENFKKVVKASIAAKKVLTTEYLLKNFTSKELYLMVQHCEFQIEYIGELKRKNELDTIGLTKYDGYYIRSFLDRTLVSIKKSIQLAMLKENLKYDIQGTDINGKSYSMILNEN